MNAKTNQPDNLTIIKGIGPSRQAWLRKAFDVSTYADLAALAVDEIETKLKAAGQIAARSEIEAWVKKAKLLVPADETTSPPEIPAPSANSPWDAVASYVVEFQTRFDETKATPSPAYRTAVQHMEADVGKAWPGIQTDELGTWMLEQINEVEKLGTTAANSEDPQFGRSKRQVTIQQILIVQPPELTHHLAASEIAAPLQVLNITDAPFTLEMTFALTQPNSIAGSQALRYIAQCQAYNLTTGAKLYLGEVRASLQPPSQPRPMARLTNLSLPLGIYRLRVALALPAWPPCATYLEVPLVQVV